MPVYFVDAPLAAPDADHEEHRHQHQLPEQVEQEQVLREERADHRELDEEHHRVEQADVLRDRRPRPRHDDGAEERGEQDEQHVVAVEPDQVGDPPLRDPRQVRGELQAGRGRVEAQVEPGRQRELHEHRGERAGTHQVRLALRMGGLPLGLAHGVALRRAVAANAAVRWDDVALDGRDDAVAFRREMERSFAG